MAGIFISYRHSDTDHWVKRLTLRLEREFGGHQIFLDIASITPGFDFRRAIEQYMQKSEVVFVLIGQDFFSVKDKIGNLRLGLQDDQVRAEIRSALKNNKTTIPILTDRAVWPEPRQFPEDIRKLAFLQALELNKEKDLEKIIPTVAPYIRGSSHLFIDKVFLNTDLDKGLSNAIAKTTTTMKLIEKGWLLDDRYGPGTLSHPDFKGVRFRFNQEKEALFLECLNTGVFGREKFKTEYYFPVSSYMPHDKKLLGLSDDLNRAASNPKYFISEHILYKIQKKPESGFSEFIKRTESKRWENSSRIEQKRVTAKKNRRQNLPFQLIESGRLYGDASDIFNLTSDPNGQYIACGTYNKGIQVWDLNNERSRSFFLKGHSGTVKSLSFAPDGRLASGGDDGTIRIWDLDNRKELMRLQRAGFFRRFSKKYEDQVCHICWSPNGTQIVSTSGEKNIWLWDAATGKRRLSIATENLTIFKCKISATFSPSGRKLITTGFFHHLAIFDSSDGSRLKKLPKSGEVYDLSYSPDGLVIAAGSDKGRIFIYDAVKGTIITELTGHDPTDSLSTTSVNHVSFSPNGHWLASVASDWRLIIWDVAMQRMVCCMDLEDNKPFYTLCDCDVTWLLNSQSLAVPDEDGQISLLHLSAKSNTTDRQR